MQPVIEAGFKQTIKLKNPLRKKTIISYKDRCKARKQDGGQCSRRHKLNEHFCGKHIHNQKYGTFPLTCLTQEDKKKVNIEENICFQCSIYLH